MDARVRLTKKMIKSTFLDLLKTKVIGDVTVREICNRAEVNRTTFYKYYDNAYDLLDKIELEVMDDLQKKINEMPSDDLKGLFRVILEDILENKDVYLVLFSGNGDDLFKERLFRYCYDNNIQLIRKFFPDLSNKQQEWLYYFIAEGCIGVMHKWIEGGMKEEPQEVTDYIVALIDAINESGEAKSLSLTSR